MAMMGPSPVDERATLQTRRCYDRIAPFYDAGEMLMEFGARKWRRELWARVAAGRVLELGVGTGKNIPFYPTEREIVAVDISERMLDRAQARASRLQARVRLELGDAQKLSYPDASFEVVIASFVFCSIPDSALGLNEALRVLTPGGQLLLLEHVLSAYAPARWLMGFFDPIVARAWGAHINRDTLRAIREAGFTVRSTTDRLFDVVKLIEAQKPPADWRR